MNSRIFIGFMISIGLTQVPVRIESEPSSVDVHIDGSMVGKTPIPEIPLAPGHHAIELINKNYVPIHYEIDLQDAESATLHFRLSKIHPVTFKTKEKGLIYVLDEKHRWTDRKIKLKIEEGEHSLQVFEGDSLIDEEIVKITHPLEITYELLVEDSE